MIFITLGSQKFPMDRLLIEVDRLVEIGGINEEVFAQTGYCQYKPSHYESCQFLGRVEFDDTIERCDLLITHGGSGAIMSGLKQQKRVIAVPRLKAFGEHVDDHQKELVGVLAEKGYLIMVEDVSKLPGSIEQAKASHFKVYESSTDRVVRIIRDFIDE
ncbi:glycosyltransferase (PssE)-like protein [Dehalobacter sp. UNSWDHB]|uniref:PssE/Cps14G family polysaccharide biosynthesis glycosyltransferase n=1 Tax=Dehalobacter sp. UNSWDHB TaxID=1339256 RepID=UPI00038781CD|nr:PssE/Cps14G family polysaccharide biosynthesis glycosyltransferase [Dehalobacter sp. UNSWDHB]EQB22655.1 glycosyltransferase (PssE)-like protein [Dehalobacter sp. UNSWDHB]